LNQKAVSQTTAPLATLAGKLTSTLVRPVLPSNFQSDRSAGALAPTNEKTLAPSTPAGLPRRVGLATSKRRIRTVRPWADLIAIPGAAAGGGIGVGSKSRGGRPSSMRSGLVMSGQRCTTPASILISAIRLALATFLDDMFAGDLVSLSWATV
jgi:hypothetical protein